MKGFADVGSAAGVLGRSSEGREDGIKGRE